MVDSPVDCRLSHDVALECNELFELISKAKLCLEDLKSARGPPFVHGAVHSRLKESEQENENLRALLRCSEYDADQQASLELENFRLQLLVAKEQAEKADAVQKHHLLLELFRKSHTDIEAARDSLQALQRASPASQPDKEPAGEQPQDSDGSFGGTSTSNSSVTGSSDDCHLPADQACSRPVGSSHHHRNIFGAIPEIQQCTLDGPLGSFMVRGPGRTSGSNSADRKKGSEVGHAGGNAAAAHLPLGSTGATQTSGSVLQQAAAKRRLAKQHAKQDGSSWQRADLQHADHAAPKQHKRHWLPLTSKADGSASEEDMPYRCVQHAVNWEATHAGHLHPPQILRVHVSPRTSDEHIASAEVYEGVVGTCNDESSAGGASPTSSIPESVSAASMSSCDSEDLRNCTVSLVDDLLRDLRKTIADGELWDHLERTSSCSV